MVPGPKRFFPFGPWSHPNLVTWSLVPAIFCQLVPFFSYIGVCLNFLAYPSCVCVSVCLSVCVCVCVCMYVHVHLPCGVSMWYSISMCGTIAELQPPKWIFWGVWLIWVLRGSSLAPWRFSWLLHGSLVIFLTLLAPMALLVPLPIL